MFAAPQACLILSALLGSSLAFAQAPVPFAFVRSVPAASSTPGQQCDNPRTLDVGNSMYTYNLPMTWPSASIPEWYEWTNNSGSSKTLSITTDQGALSFVVYADCSLVSVLGSGSMFDVVVTNGQTIKLKATSALDGANDQVGAGIDMN